jgi:nucleotide-binding universal stress UspA family protein
VDTILVGYDGSEASERALSRAAELAEALAARLVVVSVFGLGGLPAPEFESIPPLPLGGPLSVGGTIPVPEADPESKAEFEELARRELDRARATLSRRSPSLEADYVAKVGSPADTLLDVAEERDADLVVVGTREHGLLERLLSPPVEEAVAKHAERDVLLVH